MPTIAYLAPELTSQPEAFVYREVRAIETLGYRVLPFAVRQTDYLWPDAMDVARRTTVLGSGAVWKQLTAGVAGAFRLGAPVVASLRMLLSDWRRVGFLTAHGRTLARDWLAAARFGRQLLASRASHIHAHYIGRPAQIAMYASAMTGIAFTCTVHASDRHTPCPLLRRKAARASKLLTGSNLDRARLEEAGVPAERIDVVRCVAVADPPPQTPSRRPGGPQRIGAFLDPGDGHGLDDLIHALAVVLREGCAPVRLMIAGDGADRLRLENLAERLGVESRVDFTGPVDRSTSATWLRSLDLFVAPPSAEPAGDARAVPAGLIDAMSLGLPVLSTRVSGVQDLVLDGHTGYVAVAADPASLAGKLLQALAEPQRSRSLGRAARAHARWEFGRSLNLRRLARHFGAPLPSAMQPVAPLPQTHRPAPARSPDARRRSRERRRSGSAYSLPAK